MADWATSMQQTYEFYQVDPNTWGETGKIDTITSCTVVRDADSETLGYATFDCSESLGECYVRVYLVTVQGGLTEKFPLGTFLVQTPSTNFDGRRTSISMDAYTPLIELKENLPPIGYTVMKNQNVMEIASQLCAEKVRVPVVAASCDDTITYDFVADTSETWLSFLTDFIAAAKYKFDLDDLSRILFAPDQSINALQPVWIYNDDNSSILYSEIDMDRDLYGVPNVVEVVYTKESGYYFSKVINDDENSPISTVNRGREIVYRVSDPDLVGEPTQEQLDIYAEELLKELSALEYTLTYTHGYCPVRIGDCVMLNYTRAGLTNIKAKVTQQSIKCEAGCPVTETAVFTTNLWG